MFGRGVALGVAATCTVLFAIVAYQCRVMEDIYKEFGDVTLPWLTRLTIRPGWLVGGPLVAGAVVGVLAVRRPASLAPYVVAALLVVAALALTWFGAQLPIFELAGNIK